VARKDPENLECVRSHRAEIKPGDITTRDKRVQLRRSRKILAQNVDYIILVTAAQGLIKHAGNANASDITRDVVGPDNRVGTD
jgi:hypothetical protein